MFGKKVVCVSLFTLLTAAPLYGNLLHKWWYQKEVAEIRSGFKNADKDVLKDLKNK